ncbi:MAG TPA: SAM-dependent methyltransferase [Planctomycetaceae bacterium]|nr:SAM-dependent methyltransferase [Planctomycetaceae bacterium]
MALEPMSNTERLDQLIADAVAAANCVRIVLSKPQAGASTNAERVTVRPVTLAGRLKYQFATRTGSRETHENVDPPDVGERVAALFGPAFAHCHLLTTDADYAARIRRDGTVHIRSSRPTHAAPAAPGASAAAGHDRPKHYLIPEGRPCPFLAEIGVMTRRGQVRKARYGKFRQVNRFLELVNDTVEFLTPEGRLNVVDYGCGKSYLTFALHHLLTEIHGRDVSIVGLDRNADVIHECNEIAGRLGCRDLEFFPGDITSHATPGRIDLAVSLHACDTATDDALAHAIRRDAQVILAVPCCQHELAPQLMNEALSPLLRHGILRERFAAQVTDALRALALEIHGYRTQVVEFIDLEHTAKNVLLRAVRHAASDRQMQAQRRAYADLKAQLGLGVTYLDRVLGAG